MAANDAMEALVTTVAELAHQVGRKVGPTGWRSLSQEQVNLFADLTDDHNFIHVDAARNIIFDARSKDRRTPIAVVGLRDSILVQTDDAVMLAHKSQSQKIKEMVTKLRELPQYKKLV